MGVDPHIYPYVWRWRKRRPDRYGARCRIVQHGRMNTVLVEFLDGERVTTSRWAIRRWRRPAYVPPQPKTLALPGFEP